MFRVWGFRGLGFGVEPWSSCLKGFCEGSERVVSGLKKGAIRVQV